MRRTDAGPSPLLSVPPGSQDSNREGRVITRHWTKDNLQAGCPPELEELGQGGNKLQQAAAGCHNMLWESTRGAHLCIWWTLPAEPQQPPLLLLGRRCPPAQPQNPPAHSTPTLGKQESAQPSASSCLCATVKQNTTCTGVAELRNLTRLSSARDSMCILNWHSSQGCGSALMTVSPDACGRTLHSPPLSKFTDCNALTETAGHGPALKHRSAQHSNLF